MEHLLENLILFLYKINIRMSNIFYDSISFVNNHILYLNNSKFFAGVVMILLNIGSKFISIQFSKSTEEYLKMNVTKQLLIFAMAWMGTRDIYTALVLTAVFTILSDHIFNEESPYCCVPEKYRILSKLADIDNDGQITEQEFNDAIVVLEKAKKDKQKMNQRQMFTLYGSYLDDSIKSNY